MLVQVLTSRVLMSHTFLVSETKHTRTFERERKLICTWLNQQHCVLSARFSTRTASKLARGTRCATIVLPLHRGIDTGEILAWLFFPEPIASGTSASFVLFADDGIRRRGPRLDSAQPRSVVRWNANAPFRPSYWCVGRLQRR